MLYQAGCGGEDICAVEEISVAPWDGETVTSSHFECSQGFDICPDADARTRQRSCDDSGQVRVELMRPFEGRGAISVRFDVADDGTVEAAGAAYLAGKGVAGLPMSGTVSVEGDRITSECIRGRLQLTFENLQIDGEFVTAECAGLQPLEL